MDNDILNSIISKDRYTFEEIRDLCGSHISLISLGLRGSLTIENYIETLTICKDKYGDIPVVRVRIPDGHQMPCKELYLCEVKKDRRDKFLCIIED